MLYVDFEVDNKEYKLKLTTRSIIQLEKKLNCSPLEIFGRDGKGIPTITTMVAILHSALQAYHHGITENDAFDIFDKYLEEHTLTDFLYVIMDLYKVSGLIADTEQKN